MIDKAKLALVLLASCSTMGCIQASKPGLATINGKSDLNNQWLYLVEPNPWATAVHILDSTKTDANGAFALEANIPTMGEYIISGRGFFLATVFLENGFEIQMNVGGTGSNGTAKKVDFSGNGSNLSAFWQNMNKRYYQNGGYGNRYKKRVEANGPAEFAALTSALTTEQIGVIDSFVKAARPAPFFAKWATSFAYHSGLNRHFTYLYHKPRMEAKPGTNYLVVDDSYYGFLDKVDLMEAPEFTHSAFNEFVYFYISDHRLRQQGGMEASVESVAQWARANMHPILADLAIAHVIKDLIQNASGKSDYDQLRDALASYAELAMGRAYLEFLQKEFAQKAVLAPGSPAPGFTLADLYGANVSLADFKGKIVVIDFWGTWCGPCKRELPYSRELETHFKDRDDLAFVFVALERGGRDYWKQFVESNDLPGVQLYATNDIKSLRPYKITSVPRYVLVDKDGNIIDAFASRPSQNMKQQIEKALGL
ncbi:MAG: TlpA family protein disulfide reductase [Bacteroidetes bacterium]|jgi:peroxiredoxin|nr:TlpA family protein disulfide reductase [Bacteroidota bacterium]